jgi:cupin 2 domain-containing protein
METGNLYNQIPDNLDREIFELLARGENVRIERIISKGHTSPGTGWYDQDQNEWVLLLKGNASISFENGQVIDLNEGDYLNILSHQKHKVTRTSATTETIWLAIHYT